MPATQFRSAQTTYPVSQSGTIPDANKIVDIADWATSLQPTMTPILREIPDGGTRNQRPFFWGQSQFTAHRTLLAGNITNVATTLTVTTGDGVLAQKNTAAVIYDQIVGSVPARYDFTTKEIVWVSADPASDTWTIVRGQGGTTNIAHTSGALIELLAPAEPQIQDHSVSPVTRGYQYFNHFQRIPGGIKMDKAFINTPTYETKGNQLINDMRNEQIRLNLLLEKTIVHGGKQAGNPTTPLPEMMGGFLSFITTNVYNQAGVTLGVPSLETALRDLWTKVDESAKKRLIMNMDTAAVFDTFLNPYRQGTMDDTQATFFFDRVRLRHGTYDIGVSRWMPAGVIAIVDFSEMALVSFEGLNWHTLDHPVNGDYAWRSMSADKSLIVKNESAMGIITNFNTDLNQYSGRQYLM